MELMNDMESQITIQELYASCKSFMVKHINEVIDEHLPMGERCYRIEHSIRVAKYAKMIAETDGYDVTICYLAGILHDVGKFESEENRDHGRVSAKIARPFLNTLSLSEKQVNDICFCIARHCDGDAGYEYDLIPEADVVKDADTIDRIGVYRIIQALHYHHFDTMSLAEKIEYCREKCEKMNRNILQGRITTTGTKLYIEASKIQLEYFTRLEQELRFTISV